MKEIVFNGPMKSKSQFLEAVMGGAIVNIETHREIAWLKELPIDGHYKVGISRIFPPKMPMGITILVVLASTTPQTSLRKQ